MTIDYLNLGVILLSISLAYWLHHKMAPYTPSFSFSLGTLIPKRQTVKAQLHKIGKCLFWTALFFLLLPFAYPQITKNRENADEYPHEGIAMYLVIDESGSMGEPITGKTSKIERVKTITKEFIKQRKNDLIGLVGFARKADLLSPLTLDHDELINRIDKLLPASREEDNGTAIGYGIFKTINIIVATKHFAERLQAKQEAAYSIKKQAIIVLTDGLQGPNPIDRDNPYRFMRPEEAIRYAEQNDITIYFVGIVPERLKDTFLFHTKDVQEAVKKTGGNFFVATENAPLEDVYKAIDSLEKSKLFMKKVDSKISLSPLMIFIALFVLLLAVFIETIFARVFP